VKVGKVEKDIDFIAHNYYKAGQSQDFKEYGFEKKNPHFMEFPHFTSNVSILEMPEFPERRKDGKLHRGI
jgi:hypothetical protein